MTSLDVYHTSFAKISRPQRFGVYHRQRLFDLIDANPSPSSVWISGPAGWGKTTLVVSYIDTHALPVLWYQFDQLDRDPATFFYYLGLAFQKISAQRKKKLPLLTFEYLAGLPAFSRQYFAKLFVGLPTPCAIVFDNYHELDDQSPLHELLKNCLTLAPNSIQFFFLSRKSPPAPLTRLWADHSIKIIGRNEMRFTREESCRLIRQSTEMPLEYADALHGKTEGWVAGLVLLMESQELKTGGRIDGSTVSPAVFNYFAAEVLTQFNDEIVEFLLATALLSDISIPAAAELTGRLDAEEILESFVFNNLFTERIAGALGTFRYHPLFRDFLLSHLKTALNSEKLALLRKTAIQILLAEGRIEEAVRLQRSVEDWPGLVGVICQAAQTLISQGRIRTLLDWIDSIPVELREQHPWLLYWGAVCTAPKEPIGSRQRLESALKIFTLEDDSSAVLLCWSGIVQTYLFEFDDFYPLDHWLKWFEDQFGSRPLIQRPEVEASVVAGMTGLLAWRQPGHPDAGWWLEKTLQLPFTPATTDSCVRAYANAAMLLVWTGDFHRCAHLIHELRQCLSRAEVSPLRQIIVLVAESMLAIALPDYGPDPGELVLQGLQLADESGVEMMRPTLQFLGAMAALQRGNVPQCRDFLMKMEKTGGEGRRVNQANFFFLTAWCEICQKENVRALIFTQRALQLIAATGVVLIEGRVRLLLSLIRLAAHEYDAARQEAEKVRELARLTGSRHLAFFGGLLEAACLLRQGEPVAAQERLRDCLRVGRESDLVSLAGFWQPQLFGELCARALEVGIETVFVQRLIRKLALSPPGDCRPSGWPWTVQINTLGRFEVVRDGVVLGRTGKEAKKPLLMLKLLTAAEPAGFHRDRLIDWLWSEGDGDSGAVAFHTTLSRLRRFLGDDRCLLFADSQLSLNRAICQVDLWAMESLFARFEDALAQEEPAAAELHHLAVQMTTLYQGAYLPGEISLAPFLIQANRVRSRFLVTFERLAPLLESANRLDLLLDSYRRAIEVEPLAEGLYQGLIGCYLKLGRKTDARALFQHCCSLFLASVGSLPSEALLALQSLL